jgi:5,10-methylenetetrahydromethanopterin reductase
MGGGRYEISDMVKLARDAERAGFDAICMPENAAIEEGWDAFTPLTAIALATKKILLSTSIISIYTRTPIITAKTAAALDQLSRGRLILGLGRGVSSALEAEGIASNKPLTRMREFVEIVRQLLRTGTGPYSGDVLRLGERLQLGFRPYRKAIPIYLGAAGPKMLRLAGAIADGVYLPTIGGRIRRFLEGAVDGIREGAKSAGRDPAEVKIIRSVYVSVARDPETARARVSDFMLYHLVQPNLDAVIGQTEFTTEIGEIRERIKRGDRAGALGLVTPEMADCFAVYGTVSRCRKELFRDLPAGIDGTRLMPVGRTTMQGLRSTLPLASKSRTR